MDQHPPPSKTQRKQEMHALQTLGEQLVALSDEQLARIDLSEALREAISDAKRIRSREALRRQMQFIGRLMREVDPAPIRAQLEAWNGRSRAAAAAHRAIEDWRERLLADDEALAAFASEHPRVDLKALQACVRSARAERRAGGAPRNLRALFRLIRDAMSIADGDANDGAAPI